jgi:hypothetical protein
MMPRLRRILLILLELEAGVLLLFLPWSPLWQRNHLLTYWPPAAGVMLNDFFRGGVSGLGLVLVLLSALEAHGLVGVRHAG